MASLRQTETVIDEMEQLLDRLRKELKGDADFGAIVDVADEIAGAADRLASQFNDANQALSGLLDNAIGAVEDAGGELTEALAPRREDSRSSAERDADQPTKEELLEQARKANIAGRSAMTKEELQEAIEAESSPSKEKLLERARGIDLPGRSEMTKEKLQEAIDAYENATKEELLERAKQAGITGRSEMSKEELKKALESRNS